MTKFELDVTVPAALGTIRGRGQGAPTRRVPVAVTVFKGSEAKVREAVNGPSHAGPVGEAAALPPAQPTYEQ